MEYLEVACNATLGLYFILAIWRFLENAKLKSVQTSALLLEGVSHAALIIFLVATLNVIRNDHIDTKLNLSSALSALCSCLVSLVYGISLGKSWGYAEASKNGSIGEVNPKAKDLGTERKRIIKSKMPITDVEPKFGASIDGPKRGENDDTSDIFIAAEAAKTALLDVLDVNSNASKNLGDAAYRNWKLARTGYSSHMWISKNKTSNIVIKGTCFCQSSAAAVVKYLFHNGITTGLEGIVGEKETLRTLRRNRVVLSRLTCNMGTFTASKREFLVVTYWAEMENGSVIVCTRSLPEPSQSSATVSTTLHGTEGQGSTITAPAATSASRPPKRKGYTRGFIHSCGFVILPTGTHASHGTSVSTTAPDQVGKRGCQVLFSADIDMGGSGMAIRRANHHKADAIISYVVSLMDQIHSTLPGVDTTALNATPPAPGTVLDAVMAGTTHNLSGSGSSVVGLSQEQVTELKNIAKDCINRLALMHTSAASAISGRNVAIGSGGIAQLERKWTTFHDQDGITISEYCGSDMPVGTLMACCHVNASPQMVRKLLVEFPEYVDTLLEERSVICQLDEHSSIQWIAYGAIWPVGATDFLVVTTECAFSGDGGATSLNSPVGNYDSFIIASTSVDSVCEDQVESASNPDSKTIESKYNRSQLRLAGYTCTPNVIMGGTDVRLFVDVVAATYVPAWLLQMLAQYGLSEMMNRIRVAAPSLANSSAGNGVSPIFQPTSSKLDNMLSLIQSREERMRMQFGDDFSKLSTQEGSEAGSEKKKRTKSEEVYPANTDSERARAIAVESQRLVQVYLGLVADDKLVFDWQSKAKKGSIEVCTSAVPGSPWTALRATTFIPHVTKERMRDFLMDDSNMGGYDDMMDSIEPVLVVDEKTAVRRIAYKAIWPTAPRDFVVCTTWGELADGTILITSRSVWDELYAQKEGYVRGMLNISGYHVIPTSEGPGQQWGCRIVMTAHSELGGSVPSGVINMLSSAAPLKVLAAITALTRDS